MAYLWAIFGVQAALAIYDGDCFWISKNVHAEEYINKMVAQFCHLHSMTIKRAKMLGPGKILGMEKIWIPKENWVI